MSFSNVLFNTLQSLSNECVDVSFCLSLFEVDQVQWLRSSVFSLSLNDFSHKLTSDLSQMCLWFMVRIRNGHETPSFFIRIYSCSKLISSLSLLLLGLVPSVPCSLFSSLSFPDVTLQISRRTSLFKEPKQSKAGGERACPYSSHNESCMSVSKRSREGKEKKERKERRKENREKKKKK